MHHRSVANRGSWRLVEALGRKVHRMSLQLLLLFLAVEEVWLVATDG